jgi:hypothetical protein
MLSFLHVDIFSINCFVKKHSYNIPTWTYSTPNTSFLWMVSAIFWVYVQVWPLCHLLSNLCLFSFLVYYESRSSKFIQQIVNCLSAGNSFITKFTSTFSPTLSSRSVLHMGDIQKYTQTNNSQFVLKHTAP